MENKQLARRLSAAIIAWTDEKAVCDLNQPHLEAFEACLTAKQAEIEMAVRLRDGVTELRGINKQIGKHAVLYRQAVRRKAPEVSIAQS